MDRTVLTEIVHEQRQDLAALPQGIQRAVLGDVLKVVDLPHVVAITGMRRSGKSTLMLQVLRQAYQSPVYYLDFEDERLLDFSIDDFNLLYEIFLEVYGEQKVFFFDEIQNVEGWEAYVRRMYKSGYKFFITGSSADLLSSELSTKLTGRHVAIELLPFSFQEYLNFIDFKMDFSTPLLTKERGLLKNAFNQFSQQGGIPEYLQYQNPIILKNIYENIIFKDVIVRFEIKAVKALRKLSLWLLSNPGAFISTSKLKNILHLGSVNTVKNFIHYLESAYLIFTVEKYAYSVGEQTLASKKVYGVDTGLMLSLGFQFSKNVGKFLENIVYLELRRRYHQFCTVYYYKTKDDFEVDFCVREGKNITQLIQVCEHLENEKTRMREVRALLGAMQALKLKEGWIITLDHSETITIDQQVIHCVPITIWLLNL